jgi:hypothetical protein
MAGGPHDNSNLIQFRLDADQVARVDAHLMQRANNTGQIKSRNGFCKELLLEALGSVLSAPATPTLAPAE